ncbi:MAG: DNA double-strand break repair nuclease NurA [Chloroflexi bacterium]|nr:DNA double-strand break repair nuclease NurA [Chloroflexota bacterium]MCL5026946.1 DNA double-strand break repair nuclease NurA [Chloroflexota bacterium]
MTLDLGAVSHQITEMASARQAAGQTLDERLDAAAHLLQASADNFEALRSKIDRSNTPWPVAGLVERPDAVYPLPGAIPEYTVAATDGSQIEPDRHGSALYHLINIGWAFIRYGQRPWARLASEPTLYYDEKDVYLAVEGRRTLVAGLLLDMKRNVEEMARLAELAEEIERDVPLVALVDGILMMRSTEDWRVQEFHLQLQPRFEESLRRFQALGVPVAAYISRPRYYELVSALRIAACPHPKADCGKPNSECHDDGDRPCSVLAGLVDRQVVERIPLRPGERSARFRSRGKAERSKVKQKGQDISTYFFYLNVDGEIARIEVPDWVAGRPDLLDLVHWVAYDQCRRGNAYPRVLTEAHERAVLTTADRQQFELLVDATLARYHLSERTSAKERTKRVRGL